jgi:two-component system response regulator PilR (NtrC family)
MNKKVLIIDDECDLCEIVRIMLMKENYTVECAYNLEEAFQKLLQNPEIILLDNNLPDGTGLDMLEHHPYLLKECTVIMITADFRHSTSQRANAMGLQYFIQKPFTLNRIREIVRTIGH